MIFSVMHKSTSIICPSFSSMVIKLQDLSNDNTYKFLLPLPFQFHIEVLMMFYLMFPFQAYICQVLHIPGILCTYIPTMVMNWRNIPRSFAMCQEFSNKSFSGFL